MPRGGPCPELWWREGVLAPSYSCRHAPGPPCRSLRASLAVGSWTILACSSSAPHVRMARSPAKVTFVRAGDYDPGSTASATPLAFRCVGERSRFRVR